jgi:hypothetical protein
MLNLWAFGLMQPLPTGVAAMRSAPPNTPGSAPNAIHGASPCDLSNALSFVLFSRHGVA